MQIVEYREKESGAQSQLLGWDGCLEWDEMDV